MKTSKEEHGTKTVEQSYSDDKRQEGPKMTALWIIIIACIAIAAILYFALKTPDAPLTPGNNTSVKNWYLITDTSCGADCGNNTAILANINKLFPEYSGKVLDVNSEKGKYYRWLFSLTQVPVFIFEPGLNTTSQWSSDTQLQSIVICHDQTGDCMIPAEVLGSTRFIDDNASALYYHDKRLVLGINESSMNQKPQVDLIIMSFCPYCIQIDPEVEKMYNAFKGEITFYPRYLVSLSISNDTGKTVYTFASLHGDNELHEDVRELCVYYYQGGVDNWFKFRNAVTKTCTAQNADNCWESATESLGLNNTEIKRCFNDEADKILLDEYRVNVRGLQVKGTPTIFINGLPYNGNRDSSSLIKAVCKEFINPPAACTS